MFKIILGLLSIANSLSNNKTPEVSVSVPAFIDSNSTESYNPDTSTFTKEHMDDQDLWDRKIMTELREIYNNANEPAKNDFHLAQMYVANNFFPGSLDYSFVGFDSLIKKHPSYLFTPENTAWMKSYPDWQLKFEFLIEYYEKLRFNEEKAKIIRLRSDGNYYISYSIINPKNLEIIAEYNLMPLDVALGDIEYYKEFLKKYGLFRNTDVAHMSICTEGRYVGKQEKIYYKKNGRCYEKNLNAPVCHSFFEFLSMQTAIDLLKTAKK
jgi:hypothetical protein